MRQASAKMLLLLCALALAGCSERDIFDSSTFTEAKVSEPTRATNLLRSLPPPAIQATVAVYSFDDQTGQYKANERLTEYSSAVTKGGLAILSNALMDAGDKRWFKVVERGGFNHLQQERNIIRAMREQYPASDGSKLPDIAPLMYAGMLIEGGIIGYDTNTVTGGMAANYFGIGGNTEYRSNTVTVYLRAVKIETGEVLISTTSAKTIYSMRLQGNVFKYLSTDRLLQAETGFTVNEPVELAVRQAIETAVYSMIMEGAINRIWTFASPSAGKQAVSEYLSRKGEPGTTLPPAPAPRRVVEAAPAPVAAPVAPILAQPVPAPQYKPEQLAPILPPEQAPEAQQRPLPADEPLPAPEVKEIKTAEPPAPQPQNLPDAVRTPEPNALIKYLNDSRYATRRNGSNGHCDPNSNPNCPH